MGWVCKYCGKLGMGPTQYKHEKECNKNPINMIEQVKWDYWTGNTVYKHQGVEFERRINDGWFYNDKPCTKDMSNILEIRHQDVMDEMSKYQAII